MSTTSRMSATDLLSGLGVVTLVLADHAAALDRLEAGDESEFSEAGAEAEADTRDAGPDRGPSAGTDLAVTMAAGVEAASGATDMARLFDGLVRGARAAATGPAGRDLVAVLVGMTDVLRNADHLDAERFALALEVGAERLAGGDDGAHPGSMPAVVAAAAAGALAAVDEGVELADAVITAADEGLAELEAGPLSSPDLVERGVVDAAAAGFLLVLDTLASVITGEPLPTPPPDVPIVSSASRRFVVRCRVEPHDGCGIESADWLESTWYELGDLIEFDGLAALWRAELVTTLPGNAVEALFEVGRPRELHIGLAEGSA